MPGLSPDIDRAELGFGVAGVFAGAAADAC